MKKKFKEPSLLSLTSQVAEMKGTSGTLGTRSEISFSITDPIGSHLDHGRLENIRQRGNDAISACPACRSEGNDRKGDNLRIFSTGAYHCMAYPKDRDHNRKIFALVGVRGGKHLDPVAKREWRERQARDFQRERDKAMLQIAARASREKIIHRHRWESYDVWESSPQRIDCPLVESDPRHFLDSLFSQDTVVWTGETHQSGQNGRHAGRWRTVADWQNAPKSSLGPMVSPATWMPAATSRAADQVMGAPFVVLDFDGIDGIVPKTDSEIQAHIRDSLAIIRWIREGLHWQLAAIIWTGSKSLHAWFHSPPIPVIQSLRGTASVLGLDAGLIGRPEHPCRLPGQRHNKTGKLSRTIWLQNLIP